MSAFLKKFTWSDENDGCLGGEEEFWTRDRGDPDGQILAVSPNVFEEIPEDGLRPELPVQHMESVTGICRSVDEFARDLTHNRQRLDRLGEQFDFEIDTRPAPWRDDFELAVYPKERYQQILQGFTERGQLDLFKLAWIIGLHIHRGFGSFEMARIVFNGLREYLPMLLALSARSPTIFGRDRGWASERFGSYLGLKPDLTPPVVKSAAHFEQIASEQGFLANPKDCWWVMRFSVFGTVEIRVCDMQPTAEHSAQLAALVQALTLMILAGKGRQGRPTLDSDLRNLMHCAASNRNSHEVYVGDLIDAYQFAKTHPACDAERIGQLMARIFLGEESCRPPISAMR